MKRAWSILLSAVACSKTASPPARPSPPQRACAPAADADVVKAVVAMYDALRTDDVAAFHAAVTPGFYAFERGARMDGDALAHAIAEAHAKGRQFEWTVTQPHVLADCHLATVDYINVGALGDASGMQPVSWVESATLREDAGRWRVAFFHSTRVPPPGN